MNIDKIILKSLKKHVKNVENGNNETEVFTFKRKHFKKQLSTNIGFGYQDLKKKPKSLVNEIISRDIYNVSFIPVMGEDGFNVKMTITSKNKK